MLGFRNMNRMEPLSPPSSNILNTQKHFQLNLGEERMDYLMNGITDQSFLRKTVKARFPVLLFLSLDESEGGFLKRWSEMVPLPGLEPPSGCLLPLEERPHAVRRRPCRERSFPGFLLLRMHASPLCALGCAGSFLRGSCYPACTLCLSSFQGVLRVVRPGHPHRLSHSPALFLP